MTQYLPIRQLQLDFVLLPLRELWPIYLFITEGDLDTSILCLVKRLVIAHTKTPSHRWGVGEVSKVHGLSCPLFPIVCSVTRKKQLHCVPFPPLISDVTLGQSPKPCLLHLLYWTPPRIIVKLLWDKGHDYALLSVQRIENSLGYVPDSSLTSQLKPKNGKDAIFHHNCWQTLNSRTNQSQSFQEEAGVMYWDSPCQGSVEVIYCYITNYPKTQWHTGITIHKLYGSRNSDTVEMAYLCSVTFGASDGETQMLRPDSAGSFSFTFFFLTALTEMLQRLGLAGIAAQITSTWPLHVAWASHNRVLGSKRIS